MTEWREFIVTSYEIGTDLSRLGKPELIRCERCKYVIPQGEYGSWYTCDMWHGQQIPTSLMGYCHRAERKE